MKHPRPVLLTALALLTVMVSSSTSDVHAAASARHGDDRKAPGGLIVFEGWPRPCLPPPCSRTTPNYDLWSVAPDGTGLTNITRTPGVDEQAAWSPDGQQIAFASNRDGDYDIFVMDPHGDDVEKIIGEPGSQSYPTWSPDGKWIAYRTDARRTEEILVVRPDGSAKRRVGPFLHGGIAGLDWSPDGKWIAFSKGTSSTMFNIFVIRPDGSGLRRMLGTRFYGESPSWSPDGRWLAFYGGPCGADECDADRWGIWVARRDGTRPRRVIGLGNGTWWVDSPEWSPDGRQLVYLKAREPEDPSDLFAGNLWSINVDGSGEEMLLLKADSSDIYPAWQPVP